MLSFAFYFTFCGSTALPVTDSAQRFSGGSAEYTFSWLANILCFILSSAGDIHPHAILKSRSGIKAGLEFLFLESKLCPIFMSS